MDLEVVELESVTLFDRGGNIIIACCCCCCCSGGPDFPDFSEY